MAKALEPHKPAQPADCWERIQTMFKKALVAAVATAITVPVIGFNIDSGLNVGEMVTPFHPKHVSGPDAGTDTCPPCKYGSRPAVQVWVNGDDAKNVKAIADIVNASVAKHSDKQFKGFVIFLADKANGEMLEKKLAKMAEEAKYKDIALAWLPKDDEAVGNYKVSVSDEVKNTVFIYKNKKVASKLVNVSADEAKLGELQAAIEQVVISPN